MSKQVVGWSCALVAVAGMLTTHQIGAQEKSRAITSVQNSSEAAMQRISAALGDRLQSPMTFDQEQLDIVLSEVADEYGIPIVFDKSALDEVAISPESEVTLDVRDISLRSALNLMLKSPGLEDLCYSIEDEVLLITTKEKRDEKLAVRVYRIDDLLQAVTPRLGDSARYGDIDSMIDMIIGSVRANSWKESGNGDGDIHFVPPAMLVISQTGGVHEEIQHVLQQLRQTKREIITDGASSASKQGPMTQGFAIDVDLGENPEQGRQRLTSAVVKSVDWSEGNFAEGETWIDVLPKRILVHHSPTVLSQVETVLSNMRVLDQKE